MIESLKDLPLAMMMGFPNSFQIEVSLRKSLNKIAIKSKIKRINSLIFAKTTNKDFHFFNSDNFVFLELHQYGIALFYFYDYEFKTDRSARKAMKEVLQHAYSKVN